MGSRESGEETIELGRVSGTGATEETDGLELVELGHHGGDIFAASERAVF